MLGEKKDSSNKMIDDQVLISNPSFPDFLLDDGYMNDMLCAEEAELMRALGDPLYDPVGSQRGEFSGSDDTIDAKLNEKSVVIAAQAAAGLSHNGRLKRAAFSMNDLTALQPHRTNGGPAGVSSGQGAVSSGGPGAVAVKREAGKAKGRKGSKKGSKLKSLDENKPLKQEELSSLGTLDQPDLMPDPMHYPGMAHAGGSQFQDSGQQVMMPPQSMPMSHAAGSGHHPQAGHPHGPPGAHPQAGGPHGQQWNSHGPGHPQGYPQAATHGTHSAPGPMYHQSHPPPHPGQGHGPPPTTQGMAHPGMAHHAQSDSHRGQPGGPAGAQGQPGAHNHQGRLATSSGMNGPAVGPPGAHPGMAGHHPGPGLYPPPPGHQQGGTAGGKMMNGHAQGVNGPPHGVRPGHGGHAPPPMHPGMNHGHGHGHAHGPGMNHFHPGGQMNGHAGGVMAGAGMDGQMGGPHGHRAAHLGAMGAGPGGGPALRRVASSPNFRRNLDSGANGRKGGDLGNALKGTPPGLAGEGALMPLPVVPGAAGNGDGRVRIGTLTLEERRARILRYRQKRHERNFRKRIKYNCRKTLADSRPRIRGRFARNDEIEELLKKKKREEQRNSDSGSSSQKSEEKQASDGDKELKSTSDKV
uniref:CCT domain-containing protein n=1 Tax=Chloropicon laureae TaxID=464258 RepID=A0A7S2YZA9_9CHLO|mmetsp:Transcript_12735/g.32980  ORF Transcript_12735/g.32980 Transcript_12735/m.32980 type:complete len:634 (+) Transcript_12735:646-2547(+)